MSQRSLISPIPKIFILVSLYFFLSGCQSNSAGEQETFVPERRDTINMDTDGNKAILITDVTKLRMRSEPGLKSKVISTLDQNMPLLFLNKKTEFVQKIAEKKAHWYYVSTYDLQDSGWIYGAEEYVSWLLPESDLPFLQEQNKRIVLFHDLNEAETYNVTSVRWNKIGGPDARFSGYYEYEKDPEISEGLVSLRMKYFETELDKIRLIPCSVACSNDLALGDIECNWGIDAPQ